MQGNPTNRLFLAFVLSLLGGVAEAACPTAGPLLMQNALSEIACEGSGAQTTARTNLGFAGAYLPTTGGTVSGDLAIGGTLGVTGATTLGGLIATTITDSGTLAVTGVATVHGLINAMGSPVSILAYGESLLGGGAAIQGGLTTDTLAATGNAAIGGTLGVTGATTLGNVVILGPLPTSPVGLAHGQLWNDGGLLAIAP